MIRRVSRSVLWIVGALALATVFGLDASPAGGFVANAFAQAEEGDAAAPVAEPAAPAADAGVPAADAASPGAARPADSVITFIFKALGITYTIVFFLISFIFVALAVSNFLGTRRSNICPPALIEGFDQLLTEQRYQEAYELAKNDESVLGQVLSAGLAKLSVGYEHAIEAMQQVSEVEGLKLEQRLSYVSLIGAISPMIGLFGTVDGMIRAFYQIATAGGTPDPSKLAEGVATALMTTIIGLAIAIPAMILFAIIRNRLVRLMTEVGISSEELMSRFGAAGKQA
ncbi:MAG TPA: MotA/TolQ/ExbB proton channel family protein [Pirellulaceae bacterium]|jgi:biopolymer transport protein ExbB|nr:MotA/TolQ/ExbB proton channel family protein [Pirellulaceae bacterium]